MTWHCGNGLEKTVATRANSYGVFLAVVDLKGIYCGIPPQFIREAKTPLQLPRRLSEHSGSGSLSSQCNTLPAARSRERRHEGGAFEFFGFPREIPQSPMASWLKAAEGTRISVFRPTILCTSNRGCFRVMRSFRSPIVRSVVSFLEKLDCEEL